MSGPDGAVQLRVQGKPGLLQAREGSTDLETQIGKVISRLWSGWVVEFVGPVENEWQDRGVELLKCLRCTNMRHSARSAKVRIRTSTYWITKRKMSSY